MAGPDHLARPERTAETAAPGHGQAGAGPTSRTAGDGAAGETGSGDAARRPDGTMKHLHNLAQELRARGLLARITRASSGVASVWVVNPQVTTMQEAVTCAPSPTGLHGWYYWWSWGEQMHRADDPEGAASKIAHVLEPSEGPSPGR